MNSVSSLAAEFAPTGTLRASINLANKVHAHSNTASERPAGLSVDLARELAREIGVGVGFLVFDGAAKAAEAVSTQQADVGFMAVDPLRAQALHFTPACLHMEGVYLVHHGSPLRCNDEVDRPGHRIVVGAGSAYGLHLGRHIKAATLVAIPNSNEVATTLLREGFEVGAGVRQQLEADCSQLGGLRVLDGRFMVIRQAMAMPKARSAESAAALDDFVNRMRSSGFVAASLARHGIEGATVADD